MRIPYHVGIIPDGNRRWAQGRGMSKHEGYDYGLEPGLQALRAARKAGVGELTFYGFTTDNCNRPPDQLKAFSHACVEAVELLSREGVSLLVMGDSESPYFPEGLKSYTTRTHMNGGGIKLNFLVNYGWEWDLSSMRGDCQNRGELMQNLKSHDISRVDLVIRWGGMRRLSGFLPVQSVYADFFVQDKLWPDFLPSQFDEALEWYDHQDVTLGG